jgi:hypothetical protein
LYFKKSLNKKKGGVGNWQCKTIPHPCLGILLALFDSKEFGEQADRGCLILFTLKINQLIHRNRDIGNERRKWPSGHALLCYKAVLRPMRVGDPTLFCKIY